MVFAGICGAMLIIVLSVFLLNVVMTVGLKGVVGIFLPPRGSPDQLLAPADQAPAE